jgi:hypothetical protein
MGRGWTIVALLLVACSSTSENPKGGCPSGKVCNSGKPQGPVHGLRADGTVDITPAEAWPNRGQEQAPLSADELAQACSLLAACVDVDLSKGGTEDSARQLLLAVCIKPSQSYFWEERAVPTQGKNERWTYEARELIANKGCNALTQSSTPRAEQIQCEEVGCWWQSSTEPIPTVSCNGNLATFVAGSTTVTRDCAAAFATCDIASPTGCTDRAPTACQHPAKDRCDGDIRIGCDGTGRVSFHDCSRVPGGKCATDATGAVGCVYPETTCSAPSGCNGDILTLCVLGQNVDVDCKALGLSGCANGYCTR